ncbi:MAG: XRE family transcriptional regulator [Clostridia bacterium]|nr:XRE family transcriptional regulator [Clostridia bacterium]
MDERIFANNIRRLRERLGLSQTEVARRLYVTPQTVSKWENGIAFPDVPKLCKLADTLAVSPDALLGSNAQLGENKTLIAIDGGGSKTDFVLFRQDGTVVHRLILEGCNPNARGVETTMQILRQGVDGLLAVSNGVCAIYAGIAGASVSDYRARLAAFLCNLYPQITVEVDVDIQNIISSVDGIKKCTAVICGTGSAVFANDGKTLKRVGGYGYLFDDEGSGYYLGKAALRACLEYEDGYGKESLLVKLVKSRIKGRIFENLDKIYSGGSKMVASYAPLVIEAQEKGDETAREILFESFRRLAIQIHAAQDLYDCGNTVLFSGGLSSRKEIIQSFLVPQLRKDTKLIIPDAPPVYGACVCASKLLSATPPTEEFKKNFLQTLHNA